MISFFSRVPSSPDEVPKEKRSSPGQEGCFHCYNAWIRRVTGLRRSQESSVGAGSEDISIRDAQGEKADQ
jgi:hypothetical protein